MKRIVFYLLLWGIIMLSTGCQGKKTDKSDNDQTVTQSINTVKKTAPLVIPEETQLLLKELVDNGDYVNSNNYPSLIKASIVHEEIGKNIQIIDLRSTDKYASGHVSGAVNKDFKDLPLYFETGIRPFEFDKIVIVCDDGSLSSYTTALLRLMGYGNVYSMRWGMSAWNKDYAEKGWLANVNGKFEQLLEKAVNEKAPGTKMPELGTGFKTGQEIADSRFKKLFSDGVSNVFVTADEVFANPSSYYIINLERKDKYENGHIPGAIRFKPESTLGFPAEMASIPIDKPVVVYCGTGHNSGFATGFLRLFGYDARTLRYGNNGFMYNKMVNDKDVLSWLPFTKDEVNDFEVVK
ncbi:MAG TPA: rhodanese-like domain-containing protein [Bacteroidales bacterium]|nr:rhodanese-like domain-containing protein [Bacteroidales bacterium]